MGNMAISANLHARHRHTITAAFWIVVGIFAVIFLGDVLTLLAVALAIVTAAWWVSRELEHRVSHSRRPLGHDDDPAAVRMVGDSADRAAAVDLRHRLDRGTVKRRAIPVG
jgi:hypothetical protein